MNKELLEKDVISSGSFSVSRYQSAIKLEWGSSCSIEYPSRKEFGKTLFLVYNGVLRQFRINEVIVFPFNWGIRIPDSRGIYCNVTVLEIAGVGTLNVGMNMYGGEFNFPVYESLEDYKNGKEYKMSYTRVSKECCEKRFGFTLIKDDILTQGRLYRWFWNGTSAYKNKFCDSMPICYIVKKDGISLPDGWSPKELSGYATKEECEEDNTINICCFEDSKVEEPKEKKKIRLSIEIDEDDIEKIKSIANVIG